MDKEPEQISNRPGESVLQEIEQHGLIMGAVSLCVIPERELTFNLPVGWSVHRNEFSSTKLSNVLSFLKKKAFSRNHKSINESLHCTPSAFLEQPKTHLFSHSNTVCTAAVLQVAF